MKEPRCRRAETFPARGETVWYYPGGRTDGGRDGVLLWMRPKVGPEWLAMVEHHRAVVVFDQPDGRYVYVNGLLISPDNPSDWDRVGVFPVLQAIRVGDDVSLFCDWTRIVAYGRSGLVWERDDLVSDNLRIVRIEANEVVVTGSMNGYDLNEEIAINLLTGRTLLRD